MDLDRKIPMLLPVVEGNSVGILSSPSNYNLALMNIPEAWKETKGEGVKVAVIDTGVPMHRDITVSDSFSCVDGYKIDQNGHACHVSGIVAANCKVKGVGIIGIAPSASLISGVALDRDGSGTLTAIIRAIDTARGMGADIISLSLGINQGRIQELEDACNAAVAAGCTVFAAAGNDGIRGVSQPACYDSVIAVAAINSARECARFSNRGSEIDMAAGGVNVYSTWLDNGYKKLSGTSMACPAVAACAALVLSSHRKRGEQLSPAELREHLLRTAFDVGPGGFDEFSGYGIPLFKPFDKPASFSVTWWQRLTSVFRKNIV